MFVLSKQIFKFASVSRILVDFTRKNKSKDKSSTIWLEASRSRKLTLNFRLVCLHQIVDLDAWRLHGDNGNASN